MRLLTIALSLFLTASLCAAEQPQLKLATFNVDASPPIGSPLAYDPTKGIQDPLSCRGVVLLGADKPIVLCAVDWLGIANDGQTIFKQRLAAAAETTPDRVAVHTLHQHDAPRCDFSAEALLNEQGIFNGGFDAVFARSVIEKTGDAIKVAIPKAKPVTHLGMSVGEIEKVASNRRILGADGKVKYTRYTATRDPEIRAFPTGTIDPILTMFAFYHEDEPLAVLSYYATHPQSYYRTGLANPDFPGMARNARQQKTGIPHIHFNGAGGNIGAGKWNDGSPENRQVLADRVEAGMQEAWETISKFPITAEEVAWNTEPVLLPLADHLVEAELIATLQDKSAKLSDRYFAAKHLAWLRDCEAREPILLGCLSLKQARILHMPGELFVEYQLAAKKLNPNLFVAMAAYGEYAPGYICTDIAYEQGGYEASNRASRVKPGVEAVLMEAMKKLLK